METTESIVCRVRQSSALAPHADYLQRLVRPAVRLSPSPGPDPDALSSRLGGDPMLPAGFVWPQAEVGWYRFLGQIDFGEVPETDLLPHRGLLSLFFNEDEDGEVFWGDEGFVLGFCHADTTGLVPTPPPEDVRRATRDLWDSDPSTRALAFAKTVDLPTIFEMLPDCPFDDEARDAYDQLLDEADAGSDHLLGYPRGYSLAYDPTPGPEWLTLLTLASHDPLQLCWHDGDHLSVFIEEARLREGDFSRLASDAG